MPTITIVSNGHGEDVIGASLARSVLSMAPAVAVRAFPLVDEGAPYRAAAVERLGPCRAMPSGGLTVHSLTNVLGDVRAGFMGMTLAQIAELTRLRSDAVVVVGDIYAQVLATFTRARFRAVVQPLVSAYHRAGAGAPRPNRYFMERISYPERALMRHLAAVVYARDDATAAWLRARGVGHAMALGNPMVDLARGRPVEGAPAGVTLALLPGTRAHTPAALARMAEALALLPGVTGLVAWQGGALPALDGWEEDGSAPPTAGRTTALRRGASRLWVLEGRFGDVLASARVALGTAGTGNEQAAALGVPVVSFPVEPGYGQTFLENQRRLLGDALTVTTPDPVDVAAAARRLLADEAAWGRAASNAGTRRRSRRSRSRAMASLPPGPPMRSVPA
ncbi:MAG: lipid-A-disaccharide synthase-related protein, partial [Deinococcales bacterium]